MIRVDFLSQPTIGLNQSGMRTQIDILHGFLKNEKDLEVNYYNIWENSNPNIIHFFGMGEGMIELLKRLKSKGSKIICSPNHWPAYSVLEKTLMKINFRDIIFTNRHTKNFLIKNSDLFIVNSLAEKKRFIDIFKIEPTAISVVYNSYGGEPTVIDEPIFRNKYEINGPFALMAGQIGSKRKNQLAVIKNWKKSYPDLLILGGYDDSHYGKRCIEAIENKQNVKYLGYETDSAILESAYQLCDLFISPGLIETPSLSAFRALLNGAKVCSTNNNGAPNEYFGDNVRYFDSNDERDIQQCIEDAINSPAWDIDYDQLKKFSNENVCRQYSIIYKSLLG